MKKIPDFYTSKELQELLHISKQRVSDLAQSHGWETHRVGVLYNAEDVSNYLWSRWRRDLAQKVGYPLDTELITHDMWDKDDNCPICGCFAIYHPNSELWDNRPWLCINNHKGEIR